MHHLSGVGGAVLRLEGERVDHVLVHGFVRRVREDVVKLDVRLFAAVLHFLEVPTQLLFKCRLHYLGYLLAYINNVWVKYLLSFRLLGFRIRLRAGTAGIKEAVATF